MAKQNTQKPLSRKQVAEAKKQIKLAQDSRHNPVKMKIAGKTTMVTYGVGALGQRYLAEQRTKQRRAKRIARMSPQLKRFMEAYAEAKAREKNGDDAR